MHSQAPKLKTKHEMADNRFCFVKPQPFIWITEKEKAKHQSTLKATETWLKAGQKWTSEQKYSEKFEEYEHEQLYLRFTRFIFYNENQ